MTQSTFFYFVLPLGLVAVAAFAAFLQGQLFARKRRHRAENVAVAENKATQKGHKRKQTPRSTASFIFATLLLTVGIMKIVETAIGDDPPDVIASNEKVQKKPGSVALPLEKTQMTRPNNPFYVITAIREDQFKLLEAMPVFMNDSAKLRVQVHELTKKVSELQSDLSSAEAVR